MHSDINCLHKTPHPPIPSEPDIYFRVLKCGIPSGEGILLVPLEYKPSQYRSFITILCPALPTLVL